MEKYKIEISKDFSDKLGGRWIKLGTFSGEQFYTEILKDKFLKAKEENEVLHIYLDGTKGYGSSFLDQSFGQLARDFGVNEVIKGIKFHTDFFKEIPDYIMNEIWLKK